MGALLGLAVVALRPLLLPLGGEPYALAGDVAWYFYPVRVSTLTELGRGALPFWTPFAAFGFPLLADIEVAVFYPPFLLMGLLFGPNFLALEPQLALHLAIAGIGMYLLLRQLGGSRAAALVSGAAWLLSGVLWAHSAHLSIVQSAVWLPLVLWAFDHALISEGGRWTAITGGFLALVLLGGHPQIGAYVVVALLIWGLAHARPFRANGPGMGRALGSLARAVLIGLGLSAFQLFPTLELSRLSTRHRVSEAFLFEDALPAEHLLTLFLPLAFQGTTRWRSVDEFHAYMGVVPLVLGASALILRRSPRVWGATILGLALFLALGLYRPLVGWIPGLDLFRVPARALVLFDFVVALLAGLGVDPLSHPKRGQKLLQRLFLLGTGFSIMTWGVLVVWRPSLPGFSPTLIPQVGRFTLFFVASALITILALSQRGQIWPALFLGGLLVADQLSFPRTLMWSGAPADAFWPETPLITRLKSDPELFRVWTDGALYGRGRVREANLGLVHRIHTTELYSSLDLARPSRFQDHFGDRLLEHPHLLDLLNIKYLVTSRNLVTSPRLGEERYEQLAPNLWRNRSVLPRAFLVGEVEIVRGEPAILKRLENMDPRRNVLIDRRQPECQPLEHSQLSDASEVGEVRIIAYAPTRILIEAEVREPVALVVTDTYYPGWMVRVDGKPARLLRANFLFRAVCLSPGRHHVEMRYQPRAFWAGLALASMTLGSLGVGGWLARRRAAA